MLSSNAQTSPPVLPLSNAVRLHRLEAPAPVARHKASVAEANAIRLYERDQEIFGEGDAAESFFEVIGGAVRTYKLLPDGRRLIDAFHLRGNIFGLEAGAMHRFSAEAIGDVTLRVYRRDGFEALTARNPALACRVVDAVAVSLQRAQDHMLLLGRKSAREKIASFLLDLADRIGAGLRIEVPMSRTDMADHLGLTIETVSRTLTQLQRDGLVALPTSRLILILRETALRQIAEGDVARSRVPPLCRAALPAASRPH